MVINPATCPVVALDIDGSMAEYHSHFKWFAELYLGRELTLDWDPKFKGSFSRALHITKPTYREIKLAYRQGGMKRSLPARPYAAELTRLIRKAGAQVWICTTRPYLRLDNIDPDTRHWIKRNGLQWDHVIYGDKKYRDLVSQVGRERIVAVYDDLPEQVTSAARLGLAPVLADGPHNAWFTEGRNTTISVAEDVQDAWFIIEELIQSWHDQRAFNALAEAKRERDRD